MSARIRLSLILVFWLAALVATPAQVPELINYQARLVDGTNLVNGSVQLIFQLYDAESGGTLEYVETQTVTVVDGLYATAIGASNAVPGALAAACTNDELWLELDVDGATLSPRERIVSVLYAIKAGAVPPGAITTAMLADGAVANSKIAPGAVTGAEIADGSVSGTDLAANAVTGASLLDGSITAADVAPNTFWQTSGNAGTTDGVHFLGTTDLQPLNLAADGRRALRIEPDAANDAPNLIGGSSANQVDPGIVGAVIAGGGRAIQSNRVSGSWGVIGGGELNVAVNDYDLVGGGFQNIAQGGFATVAGGSDNQAVGGPLGGATVGGGLGNEARGSETTVGGGRQNAALIDFAAIGGGWGNRVEANAEAGTIAGGRGNTIASNALYASISGGSGNVIETNAHSAAVGGGIGNRAGAVASTIAGGTNNIIRTDAVAASIGGGDGNEIRGSAKYATIAGGTGNTIDDWFSTIGGGWGNRTGTNADFATISGGWANEIRADAEYTVIAGGRGNDIGTNASYAIVGGGVGNTVDSESSTIDGGAANSIAAQADHAVIGGGVGNDILVNAGKATIGGGEANMIQTNAAHATIGGGFGNTVQTNAAYATIGGGRANTINVSYATISGGEDNIIHSSASSATIGGGSSNWIEPDAYGATISGGAGNTIKTNARYASIPGGVFNTVAAGYGFASGYRAQATHTGAFVWADTTEANFTSTGDNQFLIRAGGGVGINTNQPAKTLHVNGDIQVGDTTIWTSSADDRIINFGDPNFVYIGEIGDDDTMQLRAARIFMNVGSAGIGRTATVHTLEVQGTAGKTDGSPNWTVISDLKGKTDIEEIGGALGTIEHLRPVGFRYNGDYRARYGEIEDKPRYGFIAQEYEEVFPEDVTTDPATGYRQLNASAVSPHVVAALQELHGMVRDLRTENEGLRQRITALEPSQSELRKETR